MAHTPGIFPSIPVSDGSPDANRASIEAIKQNIELEHGYDTLLIGSKPHVAPTTVNIATGAALRKVQGTYP